MNVISDVLSNTTIVQQQYSSHFSTLSTVFTSSVEIPKGLANRTLPPPLVAAAVVLCVVCVVCAACALLLLACSTGCSWIMRYSAMSL